MTTKTHLVDVESVMLRSRYRVNFSEPEVNLNCSSLYRACWCNPTSNWKNTRSRLSSTEPRSKRCATSSRLWTRTTCPTLCPSCNWQAKRTTMRSQPREKKTYSCSSDWLTWRKTKVRCSNRSTCTRSTYCRWSRTLECETITYYQLSKKNTGSSKVQNGLIFN